MADITTGQDVDIISPIGQKVMASSVSAVIASDQTPLADVTLGPSNMTAPADAFTFTNLVGYSSLSFQVTGTFTGTLVFEKTIDGSTWKATSCYDDSQIKWVGSTSSVGIFYTTIGSTTQFRVRASSLSSGTAVLTGRVSVGNKEASGTLPISVVDGSDVVAGTTTDSAVTTDTTGTLSGKLRGLVKWAFERMPASLGQKTMAASFPVVLASDQSAVPVSGTLALSGTVATAEVAPTTIFNGVTNVTTAGTRVTLAASTTVKSVTIKALVTNTGTIYVGNSGVTSANGYPLRVGASISMDIANLSTVNLDASVSGEGVSYIAVN